ncbi:MAG TPA: hypothetical protein VMB02_06655 [Candidatus Aquilonibacter sp.]|nr:hypothetical protein [Candidatus Aquilonibacter sp.]
MGAIAGHDWHLSDDGSPVPLPPASDFEAPMREKLAAVRDTLIVLGLQIVFRTVMVLRRLNY